MTKNPLLESTPVGEVEDEGEATEPVIADYTKTATTHHAEGYPQPTEEPRPRDEAAEAPGEAPVRTTEPVPTGTEDRPEFEIPVSVTREVEFPDTGSDKRFFEGDYVTEIVNEGNRMTDDGSPAPAEDDEEVVVTDEDGESTYRARLSDVVDYTATTTDEDEREYKRG